MKKKTAVPFLLVTLMSLTACGTDPVRAVNEVPEVTSVEESTAAESLTEAETRESKEHQSLETNPEPEIISQRTDTLDGLTNAVNADVDNSINSLQLEYESLAAEIDTFETYQENTGRVEEFYKKCLDDTISLCIRLREYSIEYADLILSSSSDDKYNDLDEIFDNIYDDASDEIFDGIYDGVLDDMYDGFYDGVLDDGYDLVNYKTWSDLRSDEYDMWSDTRSDVYDEWSDCRSDIYDFWSDLQGDMWDDDIEKARETCEEFQEDINRLKSNSSTKTAES